MPQCDSAAPTTEQIAPGTASSCYAMHAIIRFTRYIADLELRGHHSCLNCKHAPQRRYAQIVTAITPSGYGFAIRPSLVLLFSANGLRVEARERALVWLVLRLPDIGSLGRM